MREEFEKLAAAGKVRGQHLEALIRLAEGGYCVHRSWGFGQIKSVDTVFARFTIDFQNKPGHTMDLGFAAESLKPVDHNHILARKASDLEGLRQMAAMHHLELIRLVLQSYDGKATLDLIQQLLVPDVIRDDWKKWWEAARRELKKDGHFLIPIKKSDPIVYQTQEVSLLNRLLGDFRAAKGLKNKITAATEILRFYGDLSDGAAAAAEAIAALNADIATHQRTQPWAALEAIFLRDDLRAAAGQAPAEGDLTAASIWSQDFRFGHLLEQIPVSKHKRVLQSFKECNPALWHEALLAGLNGMTAKNCTECVRLLIEEGKLGQLKQFLARLISQHQASSELLLWLARERSDDFAEILGPEVFRAMLTVMERDQFKERRSNRLSDFILSDQELLGELLQSADLEVIKDVTRALQFSPCFDDMDKRSLLARIVKNYPAIQSLISGEQSRQDAALIVSWESLERRKQEYDELVQKKIPANSREIAIARSYGDLSENHEYKAAKEMQKLLMQRKAELESQLLRARGTDFSNPRAAVASIGTIVHCTDLNDPKSEVFTILGAWDSDPDKGIVSYLSPVAQALLNRKVGEETEFELHEVRHRHRIEAIHAYKPAPLPAPAASAETAPSPDASQEIAPSAAAPAGEVSPMTEPVAVADPAAGGSVSTSEAQPA
jgi:transcription elongation GreA/GreB family factor